MGDAKVKEKARLRLRNDGFADGLANRPAKLVDAEYQRSWRQGQRRRRELASP